MPKKSQFACGKCGTVQDFLTAVYASGKTSPIAAYLAQAYSPSRHRARKPYGGRFFFAPTNSLAIDAATHEWETRKFADLARYWPRDEIPDGLETQVRTPLGKYGYAHWVDLFHPRQLLVHTQLLRAIAAAPGHPSEARDIVVAGFQQYLRSANLFCIWNLQADKLEPFLSKNNLHPPTRPIENCVFSDLGRGNWTSCQEGVLEAVEWRLHPWERVAKEALPPSLASDLGTSKSTTVATYDPPSAYATLLCKSSTELSELPDKSIDLVVTDPPFGDIMQYGELSGFFYGWLRAYANQSEGLVLSAPNPPTALEAVENARRHGDASPEFYKRALTECWKEAHRILKDGGILAFTFHHDKDRPWVAVLESLFEADFYLEAAYPVRSDETKGEGSTPGTFGAQKVEYDIVHVCRKRSGNPEPVSWAKMRREVIREVRQLQSLLEHHQSEGLPEADLQVIRRGKALEYFSRHYGQVYVDEGKPISVLDALVGINQLLDEEMGVAGTTPPVAAEPFTRQFLRLFDGVSELPRDQMQKFLRGTGSAPSDFEARGWCKEKKKVFHLTPPIDIARTWQGRHRRGMTTDYDQAMFLVGACFENSGISATDTLSNENFRAHPGLASLLDWFATRGADQPTRTAAARARTILRSWQGKQRPKSEQLGLFAGDGDESP